MKRKVILYVAMSLDGYIAKEDDDLSFLSDFQNSGEDYGYNEFMETIDTVIIGRRTYDIVLSFGGDFHYGDRKCYVLSRTKTGRDENVEFFSGNVADLILNIRRTNGKDIYIDGGAEVVFELLKQKLIDRIKVSVIPILLGGGIKLFKPGIPEQKLKLTNCQTFPSGLVQLWYDKMD